MARKSIIECGLCGNRNVSGSIVSDGTVTMKEAIVSIVAVTNLANTNVGPTTHTDARIVGWFHFGRFRLSSRMMRLGGGGSAAARTMIIVNLAIAGTAAIRHSCVICSCPFSINVGPTAHADTSVVIASWWCVRGSCGAMSKIKGAGGSVLARLATEEVHGFCGYSIDGTRQGCALL